MTSLPIPIVVAMMLVMLVVMHHHQLKETITGRLFMAVLYTYALSMCFIGLRWALDLVWLMKFAATFAVTSTALLFLAFQSLGRQPALSLPRDWPVLVPVGVIVLITLVQPFWTDVALIIIKIIFAVQLIRLAKNSPVSLQLARLDWLKNTERALWFAAVLLLASAFIDMAIAMDFALNQGRNAASIVGLVNLLSVVIIGWVSVQAGQGSIDAGSRTEPTNQSHATESSTAVEDTELLTAVNQLLVEHKLYADTNLNLQKLARKAGHPPRAISKVINQLTGQNVSQWVNSARIEAACSLLQNADMSVTEAMFQAGFSTKSNFNREFKRVTGLSPSDWRKQKSV